MPPTFLRTYQPTTGTYCFFYLVIVFLLNNSTSLPTYAQNGGQSTYQFLSLSPTARTTAIGGSGIGLSDNDAGLALQNPALYKPAMHHQLTVNSVAYLGGINYGNVGYVYHIDSIGTFGAAIQYINYGNFDETDPTGQVIGSFSGGEYALLLGGSRQWGRRNQWAGGTHLKIINSNLAGYTSWGLAGTFAITYTDTAKLFSASLVAANIGTQLSSYNGTREKLPFDLQLGMSLRLKHLPFRFLITAHHLHRWNIRYNDPAAQTVNLLDPEASSNNNPFFDILFRHFIFGGELYLGKALSLRVGYDHLRHQELKLENKRSMTGISFGIGLRLKRIQINYGFGSYHAAGAAHHFGLNVNLGKS